MSSILKKGTKKVWAASSHACRIGFHLIRIPYWAVVRAIIGDWGRRGLHPMTVGQFAGGATKTRSSFREELLLKTMILFLNIKEKTCLDLACNDGFWSFRLARFGLKTVTGIDVNKDAIVKANFLKHVYGFPGFQFKRQNIFEFLYDSKPKSYDVILLLSIIYHLPEQTDWHRFFESLSRINKESLVIDSRWFEDDAYWYDKTSGQAVMKTEGGLAKKWRPARKEIFRYLYESGYEQVVEINPSAFLLNPKEAYGNGDPYTLENVSDYITGHRTLVIAYKEKNAMPHVLETLTVEHVRREN